MGKKIIFASKNKKNLFKLVMSSLLELVCFLSDENICIKIDEGPHFLDFPQSRLFRGLIS